MFIGATTLSDITNVQGTEIEDKCYIWKNSRKIINSRQDQNNYPKPNKLTWHYWRKLITTLLHNKSKRLKRKLGDWILATDQIRKKYNKYQDINMYYKRTTTGFESHHKDNNKIELLQTIPHDAIPSLKTITGTILPTNISNIYESKQENTQPKT